MGLPKECELQLENRYARGEKNLITDVPGVRVGHVTLNDDDKDVHYRGNCSFCLIRATCSKTKSQQEFL